MADTIRVLAHNYVEGRKARGELQGESPRVTTARIQSLVDLFGDRTGDLTRADIAMWQASIGRLSPATRRAYLCAVTRFCRWMVEEGHMTYNPTDHAEKVKEPRRVPRTLTPSQVERLLQMCDSWRARLIVLLMVGCGLRCVEVSNLDVADIDFAERTMLVRGKGGHERILPLPDLVYEALEKYIADRGWAAGALITSPLCPDERVNARAISRRVGALMMDAGVHRPRDGRAAHSLRRTAASDVLERCKDVRAVQQMLGHANIGTTEAYLRQRSVDQLRVAMEGRTYGQAFREVPGTGAISPATGDLTEGPLPHTATRAS